MSGFGEESGMSGDFSGMESFDEDEFCREHAPEDAARALARRFLL